MESRTAPGRTVAIGLASPAVLLLRKLEEHGEPEHVLHLFLLVTWRVRPRALVGGATGCVGHRDILHPWLPIGEKPQYVFHP
jgi:hypothetical protein